MYAAVRAKVQPAFADGDRPFSVLYGDTAKNRNTAKMDKWMMP